MSWFRSHKEFFSHERIGRTGDSASQRISCVNDPRRRTSLSLSLTSRQTRSQGLPARSPRRTLASARRATRGPLTTRPPHGSQFDVGSLPPTPHGDTARRPVSCGGATSRACDERDHDRVLRGDDRMAARALRHPRARLLYRGRRAPSALRRGARAESPSPRSSSSPRRTWSWCSTRCARPCRAPGRYGVRDRRAGGASETQRRPRQEPSSTTTMRMGIEKRLSWRRSPRSWRWSR